jgi:hypothetical protein
MPELFWWQWGLGALCAANVGMAKTGMPGMGVMVVPLMVLTVGDARLSAGWLLPILCMATWSPSGIGGDTRRPGGVVAGAVCGDRYRRGAFTLRSTNFAAEAGGHHYA